MAKRKAKSDRPVITSPTPDQIHLCQDVLSCPKLSHAAARVFLAILFSGYQSGDEGLRITRGALRSFSSVGKVVPRLKLLKDVGLIEFGGKAKLTICLKEDRKDFDKACRKNGSLFTLHGEK